MQNQGSLLLKNISENKNNVSRYINYIVCFFISLAVGGIDLQGTIMPFGVSICGALPFTSLGFFGIVGSVIGIFLNIETISGFRYLCCAIIVVGTKVLFYGMKIEFKKYQPLLVFALVLSTGIAEVTDINTTLSYIIVALEAIVAGIITYLIGIIIAEFNNYINNQTMSFQFKVSGVIIALIVLTGLSKLSIFDFSVGRSLALLITIVYALARGPACGAACGSICALVLTLTKQSNPAYAILLPIIGLVVGKIRIKKKIAIILCIIVSYLTLTLLINNSLNPFYLAEAGTALLLWLFAIRNQSSRVVVAVEGLLFKENFFVDTTKINKTIEDRAYVINEMIRERTKLAEKANNLTIDVSMVAQYVGDNLCYACALRETCWIQDYSGTIDSAQNMISFLKTGKRINISHFLPPLSERCIKQIQFCHYIDEAYRQQAVCALGISDNCKLLADTLTELIKGGSDEIDELMLSETITLDVKIAFNKKTGEKVCGDKTEAFAIPNGKYGVILSDGMGTGEGAAAYSNFVTKYLKKLILSGASVATAMKTVNQILATGSANDYFATVDLMIIDLRTSRAELVKAGSAKTMIMRNGKMYDIEGATLPLGIFANSKAEKIEFKVKNNDLILLLSDGIADREDLDLQQIIAAYDENGINTLPQCIINEISKYNKVEDDMTVVAIKIHNL